MDALSAVGGTERERTWDLALPRGPHAPLPRLKGGVLGEAPPNLRQSVVSLFPFFSLDKRRGTEVLRAAESCPR